MFTVKGTAASCAFFSIVAKSVRMEEYWLNVFLQGLTCPVLNPSDSLSFAAFNSLKDKAKRLTRSVLEDATQKNLRQTDSSKYQQALRLRQIWCKGTFAIQKRNHNLTRVLRRSFKATENHCLLSATAINLKRMIKCIG